jgi:hypothetical protein
MDETKRKPGGQPGNQNAVRHGFYSRKPPDQTAPADSASLLDQLAMVRLSIRQMCDRAAADTSPVTDIALLRSVTVASQAVDRLVRTAALVVPPRRLTDGESDNPAPLPASPTSSVSPRDLSDARALRVDDEIELLRDLIQRVTASLELWTKIGQSGSAVRALAAANSVLATLLRTQRKMVGLTSGLDQILRRLKAFNARMDHGE